MNGTLHATNKGEPQVQQPFKLSEIPATFLDGIDLALASTADICATHIAAKAMEATMTADRIRVEQELIKRLGLPELGKQKTHTPEGFRVVIKADATYRMDWPTWGEVRNQVPENLRPTKWIEAIDKTKVKYLRSADPAVFALVAQALSTAPAKPAVTVEPYVASTAEQRSA